MLTKKILKKAAWLESARAEGKNTRDVLPNSIFTRGLDDMRLYSMK